MSKNLNSYRVTAANNALTVTGDEIRQNVFIGLNAFFKMLPRALSPRVVDLLVISSGVYVIDRIVSRTGMGGSHGGVRTFDVSFAVQDPAFWSCPEITEALCDTLGFLTGDDWSFSFDVSAENGYQHALPIPWTAPRRIALLSEGLDSAAGLADQVANGQSPIMTVTVAHYSALRTRTQRQIETLRKQLPAAELYTASLVVGLRQGMAQNLRDQERTQRSRAFLFCAASIAAACACGVERVDLYENGVGAINLPLMTGMLFGGLATRGAHPTFLKKMSALGSAVTERSLVFCLPYIDSTKGEMLVRMRGLGIEPWLQRSRSCIHTSLRLPQVTHCGVCPACIERRQAFAVANIEEDATAYAVDLFQETLHGGGRRYFDLFLEGAASLLADDPRTLRRLRTCITVTGIGGTEYPRLHRLLRRHAEEIQNVFSKSRGRDYFLPGKALAVETAEVTSS
jgi:7-cyano-7-deazaguanine synthase in queuosine biosynthesis